MNTELARYFFPLLLTAPLAAQTAVAQTTAAQATATPTVATQAAATQTRAAPAQHAAAAPVQREAPAARADALLAEVAAARLALDVERNAAAVEARLNDVWTRAASADAYPRQLDVLLAVMEARAELYQRSGDGAQLARAFEQLLPRAAVMAQEASAKAPALPAALVALEAEALAGPKVAALRARYGAKQGADGGDDRLATLVEEALLKDSISTFQNLGLRALPDLERLARVIGKGRVEGRDPIWVIALLSPARAADVVDSMGVAGDEEWAARVRSAMLSSGSGVLSDDADWIYSPGRDPAGSPVHAVWTHFMEEHAREPGFLMEAIELVSIFARWDALTPKLREALVELVRGDDQAIALGVLSRLLPYPGASPTLVVREALKSPLTKVRGMAAQRLRELHDVDALLAVAGDAEASVRGEVARVLQPYIRGNEGNQEQVAPSLGARELAVLRTLVSDPSEAVRIQVANTYVMHPALANELEVASALVADPSVEVRRSILKRRGTVAQDAPLWKLAAGQSEAVIANEIGYLLSSRLVKSGPEPFEALQSEAFLDAIHAYFENPLSNLVVSFGRQGSLDELLEVPRLRSALIALARRRPSDAVWIANAVERFLTKTPLADPLAGVDALDLRGLVLEAARLGSDGDRQRLASVLAKGGRPVAEALRPLIGDAASPTSMRLYAVAAGLASLGRDVHAAVLACAHETVWSGFVASREQIDGMRHVLREGPSDGLDEILGRLLDDGAAQQDFVRVVLRSAIAGRSLTNALAVRVLAFPAGADPYWWDSQSLALAMLLAPADDATVERVIELQRESRLRTPCVQAMGRLRDPRFLPVLKAGLLAVRGSAEDDRNVALVEAIVNYMNDDAVAILLEAAAQNAKMRDACLKALATIRALRDEQALWEGRSSSEAARAKALAELLPLLDDRDEKVRAGAATSIATLGGVEHSVKLVKLLQDKSPAVREAAQKAIDRLAAAPEKEPGPGKQ
jgi:hypothetical protein